MQFTARDGVKVPARLFKPANFKKGGPGVVFVHGAGYLQNVDKWWSTSYYHEYMFDHILMERGFLVIDVDYRGSAGYGRDWRTAIYEHMGGKDLDDIADAAKYMVAQHGVDPKKDRPLRRQLWRIHHADGDVHPAGYLRRRRRAAAGFGLGALQPRLHRRHSESAAERSRGLSQAPRPSIFAEGLKGALLICHGMVDTNVEFEDTVRLVQRLIELRKENWHLAPYPVENHGFVQPTSWADEYKRILALFEKNLK